jgi:hypothetical protein
MPPFRDERPCRKSSRGARRSMRRRREQSLQRKGQKGEAIGSRMQLRRASRRERSRGSSPSPANRRRDRSRSNLMRLPGGVGQSRQSTPCPGAFAMMGHQAFAAPTGQDRSSFDERGPVIRANNPTPPRCLHKTDQCRPPANRRATVVRGFLPAAMPVLADHELRDYRMPPATAEEAKSALSRTPTENSRFRTNTNRCSRTVPESRSSTREGDFASTKRFLTERGTYYVHGERPALPNARL